MRDEQSANRVSVPGGSALRVGACSGFPSSIETSLTTHYTRGGVPRVQHAHPRLEDLRLPPKPTEERMLAAGREPPDRMPGEFVASTVFCVMVAWLVLRQGFEHGPIKYVLYCLVILPLAAPTAALVIQYAVILLRRVGARIAVRRARRDFRAALRSARRHPELVDLDKLRAAAGALSRLAPADALRASPEIAEAAQHPYAPIRNAGLSVMEAVGVARGEARSGPPGAMA
jgi:hypothetical protein